MPTNDEIWCPYEVNHFEKRGICNLCGLPKNEHITKKKWATKPQKSKNDATTRIITRADIEELVKLIK